MESRRFDALARALAAAGSRRGLLALGASLPLLGGLLALFAVDESEARRRRRRKRRKKRHKRDDKHGRKRKRCKSQARVCAGKCGTVRYTCHKKKRTANCGPCACDPPCGECLTCDAEDGVCIPDPNQTGDDCGETSQVCQPDGQCRCDGSSCPTCADCQDDGSCATPCDGTGCCDKGTCADGDTPAACGASGETCASCSGDTPFCEDGGCVGCSSAHLCPGGEVCCGGACLTGDCCNDLQCANPTPLCNSNTCSACGNAAQCQEAGLGDLCCDGACQSGVCCDVNDCEPNGNTCDGDQCRCGSASPCSGDTPDCCGDPGACTNIEVDPQNCGSCGGGPCSGDTPLCVNGECTACSGSHPCPVGLVCCGGACFAGDCCDHGDCGGDMPICESHTCTPCTSTTQCQGEGLGDLCCSGTCVIGVCCEATDCEPNGNNCVNSQCHCGTGAECSGDTLDCCGSPGTCTDTQTDPSNCGSCGTTCSGDTSICRNGACVCGDVCASGCQYSTVQAAIDAVAEGATATIHICAGTYTSGNGGGAVATIESKNVTLIGAGAGSGGTVFNGAQVTATDAIVFCQETTSELRHLSITGANGGYAIDSVIANLTLGDVTVTGNTNSNDIGGAISIDAGDTLILNAGAHVIGNTSTSSNTGGGGIFTNDGTVTLNEGSRVSSNTAPNGNGGGIYILQGTVTLNAGSEVTGNTAAMDGGGIYNNGGTVTIDPNADLSNNEAPPGNPNDCIDAGGGMGCPS